MEVNNNNGEVKTLDQSIVMETPLGDRDNHMKIQICMEYRHITVPKKKTKSSSQQKSKVKQLDVTILWLKNVPKNENSVNPTPFVKICLQPNNDMFTTELQEGKIEAKFFETFNFSSVEDLKGKFLYVQVCNKKVTRRALAFGEVTIPLADLEVSKPVTKWYDLK